MWIRTHLKLWLIIGAAVVILGGIGVYLVIKIRSTIQTTSPTQGLSGSQPKPSQATHNVAPNSSAQPTPQPAPTAPKPAGGSSAGSGGGSSGGTSTPLTTNTSGSAGGSSGTVQLQTLNCAASPHVCGFPDATNTGVPANVTLSLYNGDYTASVSGAVVSGLHITGSLNITANNVTVKNSKIDCIGVGTPGGHDTCVILGAAQDTLTDSEVGGGASGTDFGNVGSVIYSGGDQTTQNLVQRVNVHHGDDGFRTDGGTTIRDSYVHDLADGLNGSHSDGSQSCGGTYMQFIHNTFIAYNNDGIFLQGGDCGSNVASTLDHVLVYDNLIPNSGDSSYGISTGFAKNVTIKDNQFGRGWQVSPIGIAQSNTLVQDQTSLTVTTSSNWAQLGNIYDNDGSPVSFPGN